jgi:hypothetical protein
MINLLGGRGFIGARSPESEGLQQPIKVGQASGVDRRSTKRHRRANDRIKHPGSKHDRHTWFRLNDCDISSRSPFSVKLPNFAAMQRVPAVMDFYILADMGRMAPQLLWAVKITSFVAPTPADSGPHASTPFSKPAA